MAAFWERAAHSVYRSLSILSVAILVISLFGFEVMVLVLIATVPGHFMSCFFYFHIGRNSFRDHQTRLYVNNFAIGG